MSTFYSLGVMTGTSCDGADLALLEIKLSRNNVRESLAHVASHRYPTSLRSNLREAQKGLLDIRRTALLTRDYSRWIAKLCRQRLAAWKTPLHRSLIAVHGQTVWHEPSQGISVQLVEPSIIAFETGCTTTAAFRQPDLARGGQGAPLVPLYHWLKAASNPVFRKKIPFAIHNIGGIANLTYIGQRTRDIVAFDSGPGNALIDLSVEKFSRGKLCFDRNGKIAASSLQSIDWAAIKSLGRLSYFRAEPPKSTGREIFDERFLARLPGRGATLVANATALTAHTMATAYADHVLNNGKKLTAIFLAGGGARNQTLASLFSSELEKLVGTKIETAALPSSFAPTQYLEAMAFARLGFEALRGRPVSLASVTGAYENAAGAGIFPSRNYDTLLSFRGEGS